MSRFASETVRALSPYEPGEQPQDRRYIKLNTNESPYPPSPGVLQCLNGEAAAGCRLYPDPVCAGLRDALAAQYGVRRENVTVTNGSDEALNFAFLAFGEDGVRFPDITYGFYPVFAELHREKYQTVPLREDFSLHVEDYGADDAMIVIANPNAPTGMALPRSAIEALAQAHPNHVVLIDEAYVDFGGESAVPMTQKYDNLLVVQTFSKSRSLAGARVGYAIGCEALIRDLETLRYSTNPYNINRMSLCAAEIAVREQPYYDGRCRQICETREAARQAFTGLGFEVLPSRTNFLFARHPAIAGQRLYQELKERGVLVRHFSQPRIADFNRITIGTPEDMAAMIGLLEEIIHEKR